MAKHCETGLDKHAGDHAGTEAAAAPPPSRRRGRRRILLTVIALFGIVVITALSMLPEHVLFRQRLLFSIFDLDSGTVLVPFDHATHDGLTLRSWYVAPRDDRPVIVYFAGRDGDLLRKPAHLFELAGQGYGLLLVGYRGYGGNPGWPREFDMHLDAVSMLAQASKAGMADDGYILYGYSMGSAFASNAATQFGALGVILEAPLSNFVDAVRQQAGRVPAWLIRTRFDNKARVAELRAPILLLAGGRDSVTPAWFAYALAAANEPFARVHVFEEANHFSIVRHGGRAAVAAFLDEIGERMAAETPATAAMPEI